MVITSLILSAVTMAVFAFTLAFRWTEGVERRLTKLERASARAHHPSSCRKHLS